LIEYVPHNIQRS